MAFAVHRNASGSRWHNISLPIKARHSKSQLVYYGVEGEFADEIRRQWLLTLFAGMFLIAAFGIALVFGLVAFAIGLLVWPWETIASTPLGRNHVLTASWTVVCWAILLWVHWRRGETLWGGVSLQKTIPFGIPCRGANHKFAHRPGFRAAA